jgi:hypothetical protein
MNQPNRVHILKIQFNIVPTYIYVYKSGHYFQVWYCLILHSKLGNPANSLSLQTTGGTL